MGIVDKLFVWLSGYSPKTLANEHSDEREGLAKIGGAVAFSTIVAAINWGLAGYSYTDNLEYGYRCLVSAIASILGASIVLVFDRGFIYLADTAENTGVIGHLKIFIYSTFRIAVILAVGSITAQCVIPFLLKGELNSHALKIIDQSEQERSKKLGDVFQIEAKKTALRDATSSVESWQKATAILPLDIQKKITAAKTCWGEYVNKKKKMISSGYAVDEVRQKLRGKAGTCTRDTKTAEANRDDYINHANTQLEKAVAFMQKTQTSITEAIGSVEERLHQARSIEMESLNPKSSTLLSNLLKDNPSALIKWSIITFLLVTCEILPLLQKLQMGQSSVGKRLATDRRFASIKAAERLMQRENDFATITSINRASQEAVQKALENPKVTEIFAETFAGYIAALAPAEAVRAVIEDIRVNHINLEDAISRYPRYSTIISEAWHKAVTQISEILTGKISADSIAKVGAVS